MNEQQLAAVKQALEFVKANHSGGPDAFELIAALQSIISQDALNWMAKNARELGLDYEPAPAHGYAHWEGRIKELMKQVGMPDSVSIASAMKQLVNEIMQPAAQPAVQEGRDWSLLEATQESLREHMAEINRLQKEIIEQCRIIAMGAEREDSLRAEIKRLKAAQPADIVQRAEQAFESAKGRD
jgi:hypothetical protein